MRILGFSKKWDKLQQPEFTTFRFPRKDRDWAVGEAVQIVYKPRSQEREVLGVAEIISKRLRHPYDCYHHYAIPAINLAEAIEDGFRDWLEMKDWLIRTYGLRITSPINFEPMSKLTLRWIDETQKAQMP